MLVVITGPADFIGSHLVGPDIAKAREALEWQPRIALDEGLQRTLDYFRAVLEVTA